MDKMIADVITNAIVDNLEDSDRVKKQYSVIGDELQKLLGDSATVDHIIDDIQVAVLFGQEQAIQVACVEGVQIGRIMGRPMT